MNTMLRTLVLSVLLLVNACEAEQDLGDECLPFEPDAGGLGASGSGAMDEPLVFVGRPLDDNIGRIAGCTEEPAPRDPSSDAGYVNPFFEPPMVDIKERYGPCACELPAER